MTSAYVDRRIKDLESLLEDKREREAELLTLAGDLSSALTRVAMRNPEDGPCFCTINIPAGTAHHLSCQRARRALQKDRDLR